MPARANHKVEKKFNKVGRDVFIVKVTQESEHVYTKQEAQEIMGRLRAKEKMLEGQLVVIRNEIADFENMLKESDTP